MPFDPGAIVREAALTEGGLIESQVGENLFVYKMPSEDTWSPASAKGIVLLAGPTGTSVLSEMQTIGWEVRCYGGSYDPTDAWAVYNAWMRQMKVAERVATDDGWFLGGEEQATGRMAQEDGGPPFVVSNWELTCLASS